MTTFDYKAYLPIYIAHGDPSADTIRHYTEEIDHFLTWTDDNAYSPFELTDFDARQYVRYLVEKRYSDATISLKISAVKAFYNIATMTKHAPENPFDDIKVKSPAHDDADFFFLTTEEVAQICEPFRNTTRTADLRNLAIIMLMAVEGLRTVEVHRMSDSDYNKRTKSLLVHGKGHDGFIYPCEDTILALRRYAISRPRPVEDSLGRPTFVSLSTSTFGERISRNGIRWAINNILTAAGKKQPNVSCHMLRHSCGTNLYAETKDLRLVQETLRHKDPAVTARYAHVQERATNRVTSKLSPFKGGRHNGRS